MTLTQIFTGVLYQNHLEGYEFQTQGCNLQVITLRNNAITIARSPYMVRLRCQTLIVTMYMSIYNFKALKYTLNRGNIEIISSLRRYSLIFYPQNSEYI